MKLFIKETGKIETLSIIDPKTGCDYIFDFVGNAGAFGREFEATDNENADFAISQEYYEWWAKVVDDTQALEYRIAKLSDEFGSENVNNVVYNHGCYDLETHVSVMNQVLDDVYGVEN